MEERKKQKNPEMTTPDSISHAEDRAMKTAAQFFGKELLAYLGIAEKIKAAYPTEYIHLDMKQMYEDFNYLMENGDCYHFEFESDGITPEDLRRFRAYEAVSSYTKRIPVVTHVVCSASAKKPISELAEGINTYKVRVIRIKDKNANQLFKNMERKTAEEITKEELLAVTLAPLMEGTLTQRERIRKGFRLLRKEYPRISEEECRKMQSILYVFALNFLEKKELEEMEEIRMTVLGQMLVDEGIAKGLEKGISKGENSVCKLISCLMQDNRMDDLNLALTDENVRKELYQEYHIN